MEEAAAYWTLAKFFVLILAIGIVIVSVSLLFVPVDFAGYTGFILIIDIIIAIPLVGLAKELWHQRRMDAIAKTR